jgi:hypothetical protein
MAAYATSYIKTTTATVTRIADSASKTGISDLIGQTEGTLFAEIKLTENRDARRVIGISDGTMSNRLAFTMSLMVIRVIKDGAISLISSSTLSPGIYKIAVGYSATEIVYYINGVLIGTSATSGSGTYNRINVGETEANAFQFNDGISQAILFKTRLSNTELAQITTL